MMPYRSFCLDYMFWPRAKDEDMGLEQVMLFAEKIVPDSIGGL
jgi:hypothetical protein